VPNAWQFDWDVAVIRLGSPVGRRTGWLGVASGCVSASSYAVATAGYSVEQPLGTCQASTCTFERDNCKDRTAYHSCPSVRGQSGSPFLVGKDYRVRGILVGTYDASPTLTLHVAHLMSATTFAALVKWVAQPSPVLQVNQTTVVAGGSVNTDVGVLGALYQPPPPPSPTMPSGLDLAGRDEAASQDEDSGSTDVAAPLAAAPIGGGSSPKPVRAPTPKPAPAKKPPPPRKAPRSKRSIRMLLRQA